MFRKSGAKSKSDAEKEKAEKMERINAEIAEAEKTKTEKAEAEEAEKTKVEKTDIEKAEAESERIAAEKAEADKINPKEWGKAKAKKRLVRITDGSLVLPGAIFSGKLNELLKYGKSVELLDKKNRMMGPVKTK